ncbi:xanthine dehydrogenase accessory protein XdhC [Acinetobacter puyangensis]|uniref:Molybdenum cofactor sulfurylase n=1 Tax=Acinetobacter puyangensis TaxID=1096779 RepID=A0A240EDI9_9GAMM|nr:xanthine dehydrogenase accessory protein XdhC [Acinetobacter puyangensis]SNX46239.1 molybdenum cofactor sulfurylase [Acinetobacter puyangensis]
MSYTLQWWTDFCQWLTQDRALVLVTVAKIEGSTPREVGASMLLRYDDMGQLQQSDTIGGGHLEWQAIAIAETMLNTPRQQLPHLERFNLSARLGQCCGGVMWLTFEKIEAQAGQAYAAQLQQYTAQYVQGHAIIRGLSDGIASQWHITAEKDKQSVLQQSPEQHWTFRQIIQPQGFHVLLFGAGHVGEAIVRCLLPVGAHIRWVDTRDDIFPVDLQSQVHCIATDTPEVEIEQFTPYGAILILTHDHQQDLHLCFAALKPRPVNFSYVGMIGSKSKRAVFEKRLKARDYLAQDLQRLICPIGIAGIHSKQPNIIAIAVVAQLLQHFEQRLISDKQILSAHH